MNLESKYLKRFVDINGKAWSMVLSASVACGWTPAGTSWPDYFHGNDLLLWPGNYFNQSCQRFMPDDATRCAAALEEAARRMDAGDPGPLMARQAFFVPKWEGQPPIQPLRALTGYAPRLRQLAAFLREATADGSPILLSPEVGTMIGAGAAVVTPKGTEIRTA